MFRDEIWILSVLALTVTSILFILLVYLVCRKVLEIHHSNRIEQRKKFMHPLILNYLMDGTLSENIRLDTRVQKESAEELLKQFSKVLNEKDIIEKVSQFADLHFQEYYRKKLKSRRWSTRMNTLYYIEYLRMETMIPDITKMFTHRRTSHEEKIQLLRMLATFQSPDTIQYLHAYPFLSNSDYIGILLRLDQSLFNRLVSDYFQSNEQLRYAILEVIALKNQLQYMSLVESIFDHYNGEQRIRAYKTLVQLGYIKNKQKLIQLADSPVWEERMLTAKMLGLLKENEDLPILKSLLHDANWWVRSQAGRAIYGYGAGKELLKKIVQEDEDPFARDMAQEWLQKGNEII